MDAQMPRCHGWRGAADAQPFGYPRVLGQTGKAVNSLCSDIRPLVSCLPYAARLCVSRSWCPFRSLRRSPHRGRIFRRESLAPADEVEQSVIFSLLSPATLLPAHELHFRVKSTPSFLWTSKEKKGAASRRPLSECCALSRTSNQFSRAAVQTSDLNLKRD